MTNFRSQPADLPGSPQRLALPTAHASTEKPILGASITEVHSTASAKESSSPPVIVLENLVKFFGRFAAIRDISASFAAGRLYVVLGDNGAGKSTLLRIVAGLMEPSQGKVTLLGATRIREVAQRVGYMGHAPLLYDELSAMENLGYFAGLYGLHDEQICKNAMSMVGLDPELSRRAGQYSQGMRQRLSLARAVLHDPELVLLDEPFSNVDSHSAREMAAVLGRVRDRGKTIFVVTHQAALMEGVADEFVHMTAGQIDAREEMARAGGTSSHARTTS
jgi:heme ABC exporter ATP-binding subunit CcmA